jgi:hypothetical protein
MNDPALPNGFDRRSPFRLLAPRQDTRIIFRGKIPHNPLISLDSDENPRKSNPPKQGLRSETAASQRKPKRIRRTTSRGCWRGDASGLSVALFAAADPGGVLRVAGGIVRIATGIIRAAVRLSRGIDRLIGVAAGEHERHNRQDDRDPHRVHQFNGDQAGAKRAWRTWRSSSIVQDEAASRAGRGFVATVPIFDAGDWAA